MHATDQDQQLGFGDIRYTLSSDGLGMFNIDPITVTSVFCHTDTIIKQSKLILTHFRERLL